jgi:hypothetical protein
MGEKKNMNKVIGLKLSEKDKELIQMIDNSGLSHSELLRKALTQYFKSVNQVNHQVNQNYKEKNKIKCEKVNHEVNHTQQEKCGNLVNQVNQKVNHNPQDKIQYIENYELLEYLKRENQWLQDRIEHFEKTQDKLLSKIDREPKETTINTPKIHGLF